MKRLNYLFVAFALVGAMAATAHAQDATPPPPTATPAAAEPPAAPMAHQSHPLVAGPISFFTATAIAPGANADQATLQFGISGAPGFSVGIGVNFEYISTGLSATDTTDKFAFTGTLFGAYYVYNKFPLAMGPEIAFVAPLAPSGASFNPFTIVPGWQFLYAPFNAPVLVGTALDIPITLFKSPGPTVVSSLQPQLRIVYAF
jgi:hypothetical protein